MANQANIVSVFANGDILARADDRSRAIVLMRLAVHPGAAVDARSFIIRVHYGRGNGQLMLLVVITHSSLVDKLDTSGLVVIARDHARLPLDDVVAVRRRAQQVDTLPARELAVRRIHLAELAIIHADRVVLVAQTRVVHEVAAVASLIRCLTAVTGGVGLVVVVASDFESAAHHNLVFGAFHRSSVH